MSGESFTSYLHCDHVMRISYLAHCHRYLQEYTALGTAGGMYHFRDQILSGSPEAFFVMNCDACGEFPFNEMLAFHRGKGSGAHFTMLGTEVGVVSHSNVSQKYTDILAISLQ